LKQTGSERGNVDQPSVLIVSDDAEFSRSVAARWQIERSLPAFTLMSGDLCHGFDPAAFEMAVVGAVRSSVLSSVLLTLNPAVKPVLFVSETAQAAQAVRNEQPRALVLPRYEGWLDALVLIATEVLRRNQAMLRAKKAEQANAALQGQATLGRYMLEMRHTLNNALTSVLGNSELMLLEPGSLSATARSQIDTIRNMALRMHEILQRFSSLEKELRFVEKQVEKEENGRSQAAAGGI
jgi:signal transduction histidine kinase